MTMEFPIIKTHIPLPLPYSLSLAEMLLAVERDDTPTTVGAAMDIVQATVDGATSLEAEEAMAERILRAAVCLRVASENAIPFRQCLYTAVVWEVG
jgi:hypothetical protein